MVPGEPIAVLLGAENLWPEKDAIYAWAWERFGVQSHAAYGDYDDSCLFGYAVGQAMQSLYGHLAVYKTTAFAAHANEWQTGFAVFYLRAFCLAVKTLFTTHATGIGRSIAGNGKPLYDYFEGYNGDQMAEELNMVSKHSVEKQAAHHCHCFTTVSDLTARECVQLLDKKPDVVTPNGFDLGSVPTAKVFAARRQEAREALTAVYRQIAPASQEEPLMVAISGRQEWKNKGIDVFLQAMERMADEPLNRPVAAFVMIPYLDKPSWTRGNVTVIFLPWYFPMSAQDVSQSGLHSLAGRTYYDLLTGMDMTVFPSYYEPWGYTPMESVAFRVPTVTTDLAGYGVWARQTMKGEEPQPVTVIHRTDSNSEEVVCRIVSAIRGFASLDKPSVEAVRKAAAQLARKSTWERFFPYYLKAYHKAMKKH